METFNTRFMMSGVPTDATIQVLGNNEFGCTLNLVDFFDGGALPANENECDAKVSKGHDGTWQLIGESKISLNEADLQNLGEAIENDYLSR